MTSLVKIDDQPYAVELTWVPITNERKIATDVQQHQGNSYVMRKCNDKTQQIGIVKGANLNNAIVAANIVSSWQSVTSAIVVAKVVTEEEANAYWCVSSVKGKILPGSDIVLSSAEEAAAWVRDQSAIHIFEIHACKEVCDLLPEMMSVELSGFAGLAKKYGKLKISQRTISSGSSGKGSGTAVLLSFFMILLIGGGAYYYFYTPEVEAKKIELTPQEKQSIIDDLAREELSLAALAMNDDDFIVAQHYIDAVSEYPSMAVSWGVDSEIINMKDKTATMLWHMHQGGFISQLTSVRPGARVAMDGSAVSGTVADETIQLGYTKHNSKESISSITSYKAVYAFLVEMSQKMDVKLSIAGTVPIQTRVPPQNTGIVFMPTYKKAEFTISGDGYAKLALVLDSMSTTKNIKPSKITMAISETEVGVWKVDCLAYINNK